MDSSMYHDETTVASQRLTPAKFATAHIKASISSGLLVKVLPHYPLDGQAAIVEVSNLHEMLSNNEEYQDLIEFPGPLVKGVTHKKTVIEFCENKIRNAIYNRNISDVDSYILMWELLILLLRQNGMVVGTDIAELLMKHRKQSSSRRTSIVSNSSSAIAETTEANNIVSDNNSTSSILKEEVVTSKFRDYLIYGSEKEALEWAMKHGLWGHALFLASKLDKRTYANVMTRFANGLPINDPLQTLYQLLSGKVPSAVTSVADEKWGDWRPHLAMILSNTTQRPELDRKSITTLADTLLNRGSLYAAQFCYLMAQVGFSRYGSEGAKLVLLGSNHNKPFLEFAANEAIHMTEIYEYACSLNDAGFIIPEFQPYKYLLATRLADSGLLEKALTYLEKITLAILQNPSLGLPSLITQVCELADRLKFCDSVEADFEEDEESETSRTDNSWLRDLKQLENDYSMGLLGTDGVDNYVSQTPEIEPSQIGHSVYEQTPQETWQHQYPEQQQWQSTQYADQQQFQTDYQSIQQQDAYASDQQQDQQQYWLNQQQQQWNENQSSTNLDANNQLQENVLQHNKTDYWNSVHSQQEEVVKQPIEVSTSNIPSSKIGTSVRKRLTSTPNIKHSSVYNSNASKYALLYTNNRTVSEPSGSENESKNKSKNEKRKYKIYPFKNRSAEEFRAMTCNENCNRKSSSVDSSDDEIYSNYSRKHQKNIAYKSEEKSQLICFKDHTKILAIKNDSKITKYNTFDLNTTDKQKKIVKYKSLDEPLSKALIKYQDTQVKYKDAHNNVSVSAQDLDLNYKLAKFGRKPKHDIITNTVDSWAKRGTKNMFLNIKNSLFKHNSSNKVVVFKPLIFGGTFPIDAPLSKVDSHNNFQKNISNPSENVANMKKDFKLLLNEAPKVREYGSPKTFDIDRPI